MAGTNDRMKVISDAIEELNSNKKESDRVSVVGTDSNEYKKFQEDMRVLLDSGDPAKEKMAQDLLETISGGIRMGNRNYVHDGVVNVAEAVTTVTRSRKSEIAAAVSEVKVEMAQGINTTNRDMQSQDPQVINSKNDIKQSPEYKEAEGFLSPILDRYGFDKKKQEQVITRAATVGRQTKDIEELMARENLSREEAIYKYFDGNRALIAIYNVSVDNLNRVNQAEEDRKKTIGEGGDPNLYDTQIRKSAENLSRCQVLIEEYSCIDLEIGRRKQKKLDTSDLEAKKKALESEIENEVRKKEGLVQEKWLKHGSISREEAKTETDELIEEYDRIDLEIGRRKQKNIDTSDLEAKKKALESEIENEVRKREGLVQEKRSKHGSISREEFKDQTEDELGRIKTLKGLTDLETLQRQGIDVRRILESITRRNTLEAIKKSGLTKEVFLKDAPVEIRPILEAFTESELFGVLQEELQTVGFKDFRSRLSGIKSTLFEIEQSRQADEATIDSPEGIEQDRTEDSTVRSTDGGDLLQDATAILSQVREGLVTIFKDEKAVDEALTRYASYVERLDLNEVQGKTSSEIVQMLMEMVKQDFPEYTTDMPQGEMSFDQILSSSVGLLSRIQFSDKLLDLVAIDRNAFTDVIRTEAKSGQDVRTAQGEDDQRISEDRMARFEELYAQELQVVIESELEQGRVPENQIISKTTEKIIKEPDELTEVADGERTTTQDGTHADGQFVEDAQIDSLFKKADIVNKTQEVQVRESEIRMEEVQVKSLALALQQALKAKQEGRTVEETEETAPPRDEK